MTARFFRFAAPPDYAIGEPRQLSSALPVHRNIGELMAFWACAQLEPQRTTLALHFLSLNGFEVYCPRLWEQRRVHGRKVVHTPPLFPGYAFVLIISGWWNARWSPGVRRIVLDGPQPARVPDGVIEALKKRENGRGLIELPKRGLVLGDRIRVIHNGAFAGHIGLYSGQRSGERVEILLALLGGGGSVRVTLSKNAIEAYPEKLEPEV